MPIIMKNKNAIFLENVVGCISNHLRDTQFGVGTICNEIGLSERQLQRKLKAITGKTPNQIIRSVRLQRAKELLLENPNRIVDIALQTGFHSPSYFSKCFKQQFGISPTDFVMKQKGLSEM